MVPHETEELLHGKDTIIQTKEHPTGREKFFINFTFPRGLIFKSYKEQKKLHLKETNDPFKMGYSYEKNSQKKKLK